MANHTDGDVRRVVVALGLAAILWTVLAWSQLRHVAQHWRHGAVAAFFVAAALFAAAAAVAAHRRRRSALRLAALVVVILAAAQLWLWEPWFVVIAPGLVLGGIPAALALHARSLLR
ncbi:MAG TPA: hypothetical protein VGH98_10680 [Gemmatimonadaceae bacterium]